MTNYPNPRPPADVVPPLPPTAPPPMGDSRSRLQLRVGDGSVGTLRISWSLPSFAAFDDCPTLSPAEARQLAHMLIEAADVAERRP